MRQDFLVGVSGSCRRTRRMWAVALITVVLGSGGSTARTNAEPGGGPTPPEDGPCAFPCFETFDDGDFDHATLSGLWHVSSACAEAWSQPNYLGFNRDATCDYPEGEVNKGEGLLWLDLSGTTAAYLRFMDVHQTEGFAGYDNTSLDVSRDGISWTTLMAPTHSLSLAWRRFVFDLSSFAGDGNVIVRWRFDTVDRLYNGYAGWMIDDVRVDASAPCGNNDDRADACRVPGLPYQNHLITSGLTDESSELPACGVGGATAWYRYRHTGSPAIVTVDTIGSTYDTLIAVYDGPLVVACSDDDELRLEPKEYGYATASFVAVAGGTYDVQIGGFSGATGSLVVEVRR